MHADVKCRQPTNALMQRNYCNAAFAMRFPIAGSLSLSSDESAPPLSIQAVLRNRGRTRSLDYQSLIRHPARRSVKQGN
jgi:hypothetical protein